MNSPPIEQYDDWTSERRKMLHRMFCDITHSGCFVPPKDLSPEEESINWWVFSIAASRRLADPATWVAVEWKVFQLAMMDFDAVLEGWYG